MLGVHKFLSCLHVLWLCHIQLRRHKPGYTDSSTDVEGKTSSVNLLKPTGYVMYPQFNIQQLYALSTLYLCVLYLSENKQLIVPLTA
jgi:hypothetical protein